MSVCVEQRHWVPAEQRHVPHPQIEDLIAAQARERRRKELLTALESSRHHAPESMLEPCGCLPGLDPCQRGVRCLREVPVAPVEAGETAQAVPDLFGGHRPRRVTEI